jgi:tetratricopeptide (TPR) repeat protein
MRPAGFGPRGFFSPEESQMRVVPLVAMILSLAAPMVARQQPSNDTRQRALRPYRMGLDHLRTEAWIEAATAFRQAIEMDATFEMAYYGLGRALMPQRKYTEAVIALSKSRDLFQSHAGRRFTDQHEAQRYRQDRVIEIDEVIRQYQQGPQSLRSTEAIRQLEQQKRDIRDRIERGMNVSVENSVPAYVSLALGSAYFRLNNLVDAEREYKAAIAADPKTGEAHSNLAVVYLETGRFTEAEQAIASAERTGFKVNPQLKQDIKDRKRSGSS